VIGLSAGAVDADVLRSLAAGTKDALVGWVDRVGA
jgi:hypothetical protein